VIRTIAEKILENFLICNSVYFLYDRRGIGLGTLGGIDLVSRGCRRGRY
jgi:hypothetical protein